MLYIGKNFRIRKADALNWTYAVYRKLEGSEKKRWVESFLWYGRLDHLCNAIKDEAASSIVEELDLTVDEFLSELEKLCEGYISITTEVAKSGQ